MRALPKAKNLILPLLLTAVCCEKPDFGIQEEKEKEETKKEVTTDNNNTSSKDSTTTSSTNQSQDTTTQVSSTYVGNGTSYYPFTTTEVRTMALPFDYENMYITGYVVGCVNKGIKTGSCFTLPATSASNILLAEDTAENDYKLCVPVELKSNSLARKSLNLIDNPNVIHKKVKVQGTITTYFSQRGLKSAKNASVL